MFFLLLTGKNGAADDVTAELRQFFRKFIDGQASLEVVHKFVVLGYGGSGFYDLAVCLVTNIGK